MQQRLLSAEEIASQAGTRIPFLRLPDAHEVFARRAERLRALAPGHAAGAYLAFVASLADAQQRALADAAPLPPADDGDLQRAWTHGFPPLQASGSALAASWRDTLRGIVAGLPPELPPAALVAAGRLAMMPAEALDLQAHRLLSGIALGLDNALAPFIGAALQVHYTQRALALPAAAFQPAQSPSLCPCCGSQPVASVVHIGGDAVGLRYLQCSLCSAQWHMVRIKCARCQGTKGIAYYAVDVAGRAAHEHAVMAEGCSECGAYTKIVYMNRDADVDACADDLGSLALDLLMHDQHYQRWGVNLMLLQGDPDAARDEDGATGATPVATSAPLASEISP